MNLSRNKISEIYFLYCFSHRINYFLLGKNGAKCFFLNRSKIYVWISVIVFCREIAPLNDSFSLIEDSDVIIGCPRNRIEKFKLELNKRIILWILQILEIFD